MLFEHEIFHAANLNLSGRAFIRIAARAIILDGDSILMIYSPSCDEYKFPGGGVERNESIEAALVREVREETGAVVSRIVSKVGQVIEYDRPKERQLELFTMRSSYYLVTVEAERLDQKLDAYESKLGFTPRWVKIDEAIRLNEATMAKGNAQLTRWITRDTWALRQLAQQYPTLLQLAFTGSPVAALR
jgi:ADP-ribose pyrophosphatase YjhB (NUDIX family)